MKIFQVNFAALILLIVVFLFPSLCVAGPAAADSNTPDKITHTGFTVHSSNIEVVHQLFELFSDYRVAGSNWKFRDTNSLFLRLAGDVSTHSDELFPGYSTHELDRLTRDKGIVFWQQYPSLLWVSVKDMRTLKQAWQENPHFKAMVDSIARNPYQENSWFSLHGKPQNLDHSLYEKSLKAYQAGSSSRRYTPGIYNPQKIDYSSPSSYLKPGPQSAIAEEHKRLIQGELGNVPHTLQGALRIQAWFNRHFSSGGMNDPRVTVNEYLRQKQFSGCTEAALILTSVLRELGFPAVYIVTVDLPTARKTSLGSGINSGHQMVELFVQGKWILLDDWGGYCTSYDPHNPYIIRRYGNSKDEGFVIAKGLDAWDSGLYGDSFYTQMCDNFIRSLSAGHLDHYLEHPGVYQMKQY